MLCVVDGDIYCILYDIDYVQINIYWFYLAYEIFPSKGKLFNMTISNDLPHLDQIKILS